MNKLCEICNGEVHGPEDHPFLPQMDIHEINKNIKDLDEGGQGSGRQPDFGDPLNQPQQGGELVTFETTSIPGSASAVSIGAREHKDDGLTVANSGHRSSFSDWSKDKKKLEETIAKQILDAKLGKCPCKKNT